MEAQQARLGSDLRVSTLACLSSPGLLAMTAMFEVMPVVLLSAGRRYQFLNLLELVWGFVGLLAVGFVGTQRVWLGRIYQGSTLSLSEVVSLTERYFGRFVTLSLIVYLPFIPLLVGVFVIIFVFGSGFIPLLAMVGIISYLLDVLLTFVVPELTFQTSSLKQAWVGGWKMLRQTWRASKWYALAPGLTLWVVASAFSGLQETIWKVVVVATVASLLSLIFRGAILLFYLRLRPDAPDPVQPQTYPAQT